MEFGSAIISSFPAPPGGEAAPFFLSYYRERRESYSVESDIQNRAMFLERQQERGYEEAARWTDRNQNM